MLVRTVAAAVAAPPLAALADRYPRRGVMAISDLIRAVLTAAIAILVEAQAPIVDRLRADGRPSPSSGRCSARRRRRSRRRSPATPEELTASNAVAGTIESASIFLGPGHRRDRARGERDAGRVRGLRQPRSCGPPSLVWSIDEPGRTGGRGRPRRGRDARRNAGRLPGARRRRRALLAVTVTYAAQAMVAGALTVFTVVLAIDVLHLGNAGVGYLDCAFGVGGILGGVAAVGLAGARRLAAGIRGGRARVGRRASRCSASPRAPPSRSCSWPAWASATRSSTSRR